MVRGATISWEDCPPGSRGVVDKSIRQVWEWDGQVAAQRVEIEEKVFQLGPEAFRWPPPHVTLVIKGV